MQIFNNREGWSVGGKGGVRHFHWQTFVRRRKLSSKQLQTLDNQKKADQIELNVLYKVTHNLELCS